jgi:FkbH-like protein
VAGRCLDKAFGDIRFSYTTFALSERLNRWLLKRRDNGVRPDAFVFECYNPGSQDVIVQMYVAVDRTKVPKSVRPEQLPPPFTVRFAIAPGYFRRDIPFESMAGVVDTNLAFDLSIIPDSGEGAHLVFLALDFVTYDNRQEAAANVTPISKLTTIAPAAYPAVAAQTEGKVDRPPAKCVVFDLDNTLWSGILLEGEVSLKPGVQELLRTLDSRGILLSLASKNSGDHAKEKLVEFGIEEYFLFPRVNWGRKSDNLRAIVKDIDIGIDTIIFVDDNPFERDEVAAALPLVEVLPETSLDRLAEHHRLLGTTSAEAKLRRQMYRQAMVRAAEAQEFGEDYKGFLRSCKIRIEIRPPLAADFERISELVQRTNQLNFSGTKYKAEEVAAVLSDQTLEKWVLACADKYGSYGTIGFCIAKRSLDSVRVIDFMLSCRVQGKFIEQALFHHLIRSSAPVRRLEINFKKTNRNAPAQEVLRRLGFDVQSDGVLARDVVPGDLAVDFLEVASPTAADPPAPLNR